MMQEFRNVILSTWNKVSEIPLISYRTINLNMSLKFRGIIYLINIADLVEPAKLF